jgi:hypothetical protein
MLGELPGTLSHEQQVVLAPKRDGHQWDSHCR